MSPTQAKDDARRLRGSRLRRSAAALGGGCLVALAVLVSCSSDSGHPPPMPPCVPEPGIVCNFTPASGGSQPNGGGLPEGEGGAGGDTAVPDAGPFDGNLGPIPGFDGNLGPPT